MRRLGFLAMVTAAVALSGAGAGCSSKTKTAEQAKSGEHSDHNDGQGKHEHSGEIKENLAKLSEADRASAEKQEMCPVEDSHLGSMGVPVKVNVKGQDVWVCCKSCKGLLEKDPDMYLAKLKKKHGH
ncbi:MAG: hypothetical protein ACE5KM_05435 [Planctomycetaceae bacterium]